MDDKICDIINKALAWGEVTAALEIACPRTWEDYLAAVNDKWAALNTVCGDNITVRSEALATAQQVRRLEQVLQEALGPGQ